VAEPFRILDPDGRLVGEPPAGLHDGELQAMLRLMLLGRRIDAKAISLQRRGKLGTYAPLSGQEAASVGSVHARSGGREAAVDEDRLPGQVAGRAAGQEHGHACEVVELAVAADHRAGGHRP
jgi:TPP-dependent pyruvate/acetoin dehydrogenase alpha subunit